MSTYSFSTCTRCLNNNYKLTSANFTNYPMNKLYRNPAFLLSTLWAGIISIASVSAVVHFESDFESEVVDSAPAGGSLDLSPDTPEAEKGVIIIDGSSTPSSPFGGKSLYVYDLGDSGNVRYVADIDGGDNVSSVQVDFDFALNPAIVGPESSTEINFTVGKGGVSLTSSSRRAFEMRILQDGTIDMRSEGTSTQIGTFSTGDTHSLSVLLNSDDAATLDYSTAGGGSGTLSSNTFHVYLDGVKLGEYAFFLDPSDAGVAYNEGVADLGRVAFYQDTGNTGALIIDNLKISGISAGVGSINNVYSSLDFEADTVGEQPVVESASYTPGTNGSVNGAVVIDADSTPVANPLTGQSLYFYDLGTASGNSTHFRYPFNGGDDVSELRVDFDFQRGYVVDAPEGDTGIHVSVGRALAGALNNSDFRPFRLLIFNDGTLSLNDLNGTTGLGDFDVENPNKVSFLINSHDSQNVDYDLPKLGSGVLEPNTLHVFLNEVKMGEFDFHITPDPDNAPQIVFNDENNDLGQIAFFQDTNSEGGIAFDNITISRVNPIGSPPNAATGLATDTIEARRVVISWTDASDNELGFEVERKQGVGGTWEVINVVDADTTTFEDLELNPETTYLYRVTATNGLQSDPTSEVEVVTLEQVAPLIVDSIGDDFAIANTSIQLAIVVIGRDPLSYQWYEGALGDTSKPVTGANAAIFNTPSLASDTSFWARATNSEGSFDSQLFEVEVHFKMTFNVSTKNELDNAIGLALPGDEIIVADGEYTDWRIEFQASGLESAPIILRAENPGEVIFKEESRLEIGGEWLVFDGFAFEGEYSGNDDEVIQFRADTLAFDCRVTNVSIFDYIPSDGSKMSYVSMYGRRNRVDNCYFTGHDVPGVTLVIWLDGQPNFHRIDHNHFANRIDGQENGWETIRIGTSNMSMSNSKTTVEYNLFTRVDGEIEIISNKSGENVYRYNTFKESRGTLTLRHGDRCLVEGNYFLGGNFSETGGVRVIGRDHIVINNYFEKTTARDGATITVYAGISGSPLNGYFSADRTILAFNTFFDNNGSAIEIAAGFGERDRTIAPTGIVIANNVLDAGTRTTGEFVYGENPEAQTWAGNIIFGKNMGGSLVSGFVVEDPLLVVDPVSGIARPSASSPVIDAASEIFDELDLDIDGQQRDAIADVGADEIVATPKLLSGPLTETDIGPTYLGAERILGGTFSRLVNQSLRAEVTPGSGTLIGGFVVRGGMSKSMLIRAVGPSLDEAMVPVRIPDPVLTVYNSDGQAIMTNDDWGDTELLKSTFADVGAFSLTEGSTDSAILAIFEPGLYTTHVESRNGEPGEALLEVYDVSGEVSLANQSSRSKHLNPGETSMAGFVIGGNADKTLLIRGIGPGLLGLNVDDASPDVKIEVFNEVKESIAINDNWGDSTSKDLIQSMGESVGAFDLDANSLDAALFIRLSPGLYTVHLTGPNDAVGVSLIELYEIPEE